MNKKFHTINLRPANPAHSKAVLFYGVGFTHAEPQIARFEKGKCYEIQAYGATYRIRFISQNSEALYAEFWYNDRCGGYGKFYGAELIREIPQIPINMIRGERYVAKLKGHYEGWLWLFDFDKVYEEQIYYLTFRNDLIGDNHGGKGCLVFESDVDFIVPEHIWNQHYSERN